MASRAKAERAGAVQSDYDKLRRIPFLYAFNSINTAALLCTISTPLALYAAELGIEKGRIGVLGGLLPFAQLFCIAFLPLAVRFSQRVMTALGYGLRHLFLLSWFAAPFLASPEQAFWLLFASLGMFALFRTMAETAVWPWSQEYLPRQVRGRVSGITSLVVLPVALGGSLLIQLWLDSRTGIDRFFPVFGVGIALGLMSVLFLLGLRGGQPRPDSPRGLDAIRGMRAPLGDRGFWLYLYSSGTQYFAYTALNLFLILFFRERLGMSSGQLVTLTALVPLGGAIGGLVAGWFVDRYGTRAIRVTLQGMQVVLLLSLLLIDGNAAAPDLIAGAVFFLMGLLFQSSIATGGIYLLNYVPPAHKENYMTLAYASDGLIGGGATVLAGILLQLLLDHPVSLFGAGVDSYALLFVVTAIVVVTSAVAFGLLREEGATGVRAFFGYFGHGSAMRALLAIPRYGAPTSEERRQELTYGFGGTRSALVEDELIEALSDPSYDVRHEAIQSLAHLPPSRAVVRALERVLDDDVLAELQYAALASLGRLKAIGSAERVAAFLGSANPLLRSRALRTLGDLRDQRYLPRIRELLREDPARECRLAAVSALGTFRDAASVGDLVTLYREFGGDGAGAPENPHGRVVLLALAKILGLEEAFSREWRLEERIVGFRLPSLVSRLAGIVRRLRVRNAQALGKQLMASVEPLGAGDTVATFAALQDFRQTIERSDHPDARLVLLLMDGTADIVRPNRALVILLALSIRRVLRPSP
jgi:MFS family permease